jgi:hypothetical protein
MSMNPVEAFGPSGISIPSDPKSVRSAARDPKANQPAAPQASPGAASDSVEFSADAQKLAAGAADADSSREQLVAAARQKLLSGRLSGPGVAESAAENLLSSGDLEKV